ncbi:DNA polymerase IV [Rhodopirellula sp. JC740]|uniref:DNA polymerase IV n=1 Tax=Rhodopirellula halodulae TaxID=2894198 RepID=A0ABS8NLH6_9BACT|nr:DNA polymerase IV [Rhodopirellula sp. JC740]MCC9644410.1 DNA polymerase IV [Rhodopirellula sp. JC740]
MILHVDMDAFYASIEQRDRPELRGTPVVVGGSEGRGVVTAASYEAREYGIHSAMPGSRAVKLCPHATFVRGRLDHYAAVGRAVREIFHRFTPVVQPLSLDEAFLDVSGTIRLHGSPREIGMSIRETIRRELDLPASVGIAPLKFVAKIASDIGKPNGFVEVPENGVREFLDPLPVARLWGVGKVGQAKLQRMGYRTIAELRVADRDRLESQLGRWGLHLWNLANGIDARRVVVDRQAKGIGHERTFSEDLSDMESLSSVVSYLCEQTCRRLRRARRLTSTVTLKYRREDFQTFSRARKLSDPTDSTLEILKVAETLLAEMRQRQPRSVRLLGVSLGGLSEADAPKQMNLFAEESGDEASSKVDSLSDEIASKLGKHSVYRASSHQWVDRKNQPPK